MRQKGTVTAFRWSLQKSGECHFVVGVGLFCHLSPSTIAPKHQASNRYKGRLFCHIPHSTTHGPLGAFISPLRVICLLLPINLNQNPNNNLKILPIYPLAPSTKLPSAYGCWGGPSLRPYGLSNSCSPLYSLSFPLGSISISIYR